jgi:riboflavin kinase
LIFEDLVLKKVDFVGTVFSGQSEGKRFLKFPWVKKQIQEKLGFQPYPGTLILRLFEKTADRKRLLDHVEGFRICPANGYCSGLLFKARIGAQECAVVVPLVESYPVDVLEVVASVNLKERCRLTDGDTVTVTVYG